MAPSPGGQKERILATAKDTFQASHQSGVAERTFLHNIEEILGGEGSYILSSDIEPVDDAPNLTALSNYRAAGEQALSQLLVCKLNGGLGTSMGLEQAKSLLPVRDGASFIDLTLRQVLSQRLAYGVQLPFLCMNSFRTEEDTLRRIPSDFNEESGIRVSMLQNQVPKIDAETFLPVKYPQEPELEWCPPGHGDLYPVLIASGVLEEALQSGKKYLFVSNSDNLGATISLELLGYIAERNTPFVMEVALRTEVDRKGGHLARRKDGPLLLRESAQVAPGEEEDFQNYRKYTAFNTNSLWIDLEALKELVEFHRGIVPLPVIRNVKPVNPRDPDSQRVIQLETAMGSAISLFERAEAVVVPRTRFLPVKTTDDLLRVRSDLFSLTESGELVADESKLSFPVSLDPEYYGRIDDFEARFPYGIPSLVEATQFSVRGNVFFGRGVICRGDVVLEHTGKDPLYVPDGQILSA